MSDLSLIKDFKSEVGEILNSVKNFLHIGNGRSISDIKKKAKEHELSLFAIATENVATDLYQPITNTIEAEVVSAIEVILTHVISEHPEAATDFILHNLTNNSDLHDKFRSSIQDVNNSLGENIEVMLTDIKLGLSENKSKSTTQYLQYRDANGNVQVDPIKKPFGDGYRYTNDDPTKMSTISKNDREALKIQGNYHNLEIRYVDLRQEVHFLKVTIFVRVKLIPVDSDKVIEAVASARNRNMFFSYLRWRAKDNGFWKDFFVNLGEIEKQVKRDTSNDVKERLLGSLLSKSGFTRPKALGDVTELKRFTLVLTMDDVDRLNTQHNMNLLKAGALTQVFNNMAIMSLIVIDEAKQRAILYESDRPTEMDVIPLSTMNDARRLANLFRNING